MKKNEIIFCLILLVVGLTTLSLLPSEIEEEKMAEEARQECIEAQKEFQWECEHGVWD